MELTFTPFYTQDLEVLRTLWNDVLKEGNAFPGDTLLDADAFLAMLKSQSSVTCMLADGQLAGYYILHPNNIGRCSHTANASYVMAPGLRGRRLGRRLVEHSLEEARELGFRGMQFNAVVAGNAPALHIYSQIGFRLVGTIPGGFRLKDGRYSDMHIMFFPLV